MSLPSLCLIEVASLLYLSSHLVLSLFFCPWFRESVSSRRSPVLTACLLHRYLKPSQSLSLWGSSLFPRVASAGIVSEGARCLLPCRPALPSSSLRGISWGPCLVLACVPSSLVCPSCSRSFSLSIFLPYSLTLGSSSLHPSMCLRLN